MIRPSVEYASVDWHTILTKEQAGSLERQQSVALKNILGVGLSARRMRERLEIEELSARRDRRVLNFEKKCFCS